ncbi:MAG TPA: hypothetical protein VFN35_27140 [Ktedonobacteraceae bacterium]|nr:hypothetical protein [Ktedonobacteraceae bacterium]
MYEALPGKPHPPGVTPDSDGVNFVLFSEHATSVELLLFAPTNGPEPVQIITLDPKEHLTK